MAPSVALIDDDPDFLSLMQDLLAEEGYTTHACTNRAEALDCLQQHSVDLVILDIRLHSDDEGWFLLEAIRQTPATAHIPVIVCSADSATWHGETLARYRDMGVEYLEKPFDVDDLLDLMRGMTAQPVADHDD